MFSPDTWLDSSVGRALYRFFRGHSLQSHNKLRTKLRWVFTSFIGIVRKICIASVKRGEQALYFFVPFFGRDSSASVYNSLSNKQRVCVRVSLRSDCTDALSVIQYIK